MPPVVADVEISGKKRPLKRSKEIKQYQLLWIFFRNGFLLAGVTDNDYLQIRTY